MPSARVSLVLALVHSIAPVRTALRDLVEDEDIGV
jgi:hypothetical protein